MVVWRDIILLHLELGKLQERNAETFTWCQTQKLMYIQQLCCVLGDDKHGNNNYKFTHLHFTQSHEMSRKRRVRLRPVKQESFEESNKQRL